MSEIKNLFNQTIVYGFSSVVARILNFFLVPLYTVLFMPSEYAILAEMYAYAALIMVLGSFGMETAFFRFYTTTKNPSSVFSTAFSFVLSNAILFLFLGSVFQQEIANFLGHSNHPEYVLYFVLIIGFDLFSIIPFSILRQQNKALKFAVIKTVNILINISLNLFFLLLCPYLLKQGWESELIGFFYTPPVSVLYVFISNLIASLLTVIILFSDRTIIIINLIRPNYTLLKKMLNYSWPILIAGIAFIINETADKILIKHLLPKGIAMRELGIYSACYKLTIFMTLFVQAYRFAAEPFFFNQFSKPNAKKVYSLMLQVFTLLSLFIFLFVVLYLDFIKLIIPNTLYHEGLKIVPIVLLANIFLGIYYNLSVWYKVTNKTYYAAVISTIGALLTIILNIVLIPKYGYMGAAWTTLICYATMTLVSFYLGQHNFKINYSLRTISYYFLITLSVFFVSQMLTQKIYNIQIDNTILFLLYIIFMYMELRRIFFNKKKQILS